MGVMIPAGTDNLVVSDKAISVSNLINGSTRLQPVVLLTGQAAGTLAAIAAREGCTPREVPVRRLQAALLARYTHPANDGRAVPVGEPHVVLSRARDLRR